METPLVSAILVSYNTRDLTLRAIEDLKHAAREISLEIWVVDNASSDDSVAQIGARFPDVRVIASPDNLGFGAANNRAMERAQGEYFLLLNTDAFLQPDALTEMLRAAQRYPRAAVIGPRLLNEDGSRQKSVWPFPTPAQSWTENLGIGWFSRRLKGNAGLIHSPDDEGEVPWIIGACMLVRRAAYEQVGGFDPRFWMYAEETDWQKTMRGAGWIVAFAPQSVVVHLGGASGIGSQRVAEEFFHSSEQYTLKHHGATGLLVSRAALMLGQLARLPFAEVRARLQPHNKGATEKLQLVRWLVNRGLRAPSPAAMRARAAGRTCGRVIGHSSNSSSKP